MSRPLDLVAILLMLMLCLTWGFNQVAVKLALPDIPPLTQAAIRSAGAAVILYGWMLARGIPLFGRDGTLRAGLFVGTLFAIEFLLIYPGLLWTTASRAVVFIYTMPFFVVIGARWLLPGDGFNRSQWFGLLLSFAGMAVAFGVPTPAADPRQWLGDAMILVAALAWAGTTLGIKASALNKASAEKTLLYQLVVSAVILSVAALAFGEQIVAMPSARAIGWMTFQTVWVVAITFLIWFALMQRYSASRLSAFSFLTPLFGVAAGYFMLDEPITPAFIVAAVLVAAGLLLVNRPQ
jgi:drug/metabolite transporter (DMT)-like permease